MRARATSSSQRFGPGPRISILARGALRCRIERPNTRQYLITSPGVPKKLLALRGASIHVNQDESRFQGDVFGNSHRREVAGEVTAAGWGSFSPLRACLVFAAGRVGLESGSFSTSRGTVPRFAQTTARGYLPALNHSLTAVGLGKNTRTSKLSVMLGTQNEGATEAAPS